MNFSDIHAGQLVFVNSLESTRYNLGINDEMKKFIGKYVTVHSLHGSYKAIRVTKPSDKYDTYLIHHKDLSLDPIVEGETKIYTVNSNIKETFDAARLDLNSGLAQR